MILKENSIRKIIRQLLIIETDQSFGGNISNSRVRDRSKDFSSDGSDSDYTSADVSNDDLSKADIPGFEKKLKSAGAKRSVNINSVRQMAAATGLRIDFIYGVQSRESGGKESAMALNPHLLSVPSKWASGVGINETDRKAIIKAWKAAGIETKKPSANPGNKYSGSYFNAHKSPNNKKFDDMYKISPTGTITGAALGLYQVLGWFMLSDYGNDGAALYDDFKRDPLGYSNKSFIKWVNHKSNSKFKSYVNGGENSWGKAVKKYYGGNSTDYTNHVKEYARYFRESLESSKKKPNNSSSSSEDWSGKLGKFTKRGINFHKILDNKNNYRAGIKNKHTNPTVEFWQKLKNNYKIKNVISLNADEGGRAAANNAVKAGLNVFKNFIHEDDMGNKSAFDKAKQMLKDGNTLIHCTHGADRTGAYVGRYYMEELGWDFDRAMADTKKYGGHKSAAGYKSARDFLKNGPAQ